MQTQLNPGATALTNPARHADTGPAGQDGRGEGLRRAGSLGDDEFVFLQQAYRPSGGLAHGDELATRLHVDGAGGYARLARWIVGRHVFSFAWHEHFWLPMFQFDPHELTPRPGLRLVLAELADVMDGRALADWFALPSGMLNGRSPADMWARQGPAVQQAARLQRCAITG